MREHRLECSDERCAEAVERLNTETVQEWRDNVGEAQVRTLSSDWLIILLVNGHYYFLHTGQLMLIPYSDWLIISRLASPDTQDYTDSGPSQLRGQ